jgi:hypothetical protein
MTIRIEVQFVTVPPLMAKEIAVKIKDKINA